MEERTILRLLLRRHNRHQHAEFQTVDIDMTGMCVLFGESTWGPEVAGCEWISERTRGAELHPEVFAAKTVDPKKVADAVLSAMRRAGAI
jgi:hypothetical protein